MTRPTNRWKLGLFVVTGFMLLVAVLGWLGATRLDREVRLSHCFFDQDVNGLDVGSPVKFRGVPIGKVKVIRAAPDQRHVEVISEIYVDSLEAIGLDRGSTGPEDGPFAPPELRVQLITSMLTGVGFIQGDFFDPEQYPLPEYPFEIPWNTVHPVPSTYKSLEEGLVELADAIPVITKEVTHVLLSMERTLEEMQLGALAQEARTLMTTASDALAQFEDLSIIQRGDSALAQAERTLAELEGLLQDLRGKEGALERVAQRFDALGLRAEEVLTESDLPATTSALRSVGSNVDRAAAEFVNLSQDLRSELDVLRATLQSVRGLADRLERDPGSLVRGRSSSTIPNLDTP